VGGEEGVTGGGNTSRKVLVTGGGGFLGSAIVKQLLARGDDVRTYSRHRYPSLTALKVDQVQGDIAGRANLLRACRGRELVFHVAAKPGVWGAYRDYYDTNVIGTRNVITACKAQAVPFLVYTSSPSVVFDGGDMEGTDESAPYPDTYRTHYQSTKAEAERAVAKAADDHLRTIILRPHLIWGPGDNHLVPRIISRSKWLFRIGNGENLVDTVYIDNAATAHLLAADRLMAQPDLSGNIYFISQGEPIRLWDMIDRILEAGGLGPVTRSIPTWLAWWIGAVSESIYRLLRLKGEPRMTRFVAEELSSAHWFDIGAAVRDLGYQPKVSIDEGLTRLRTWLMPVK